MMQLKMLSKHTDYILQQSYTESYIKKVLQHTQIKTSAYVIISSALYNLYCYAFTSVNNVKTTIEQHFKLSVFICLFSVSASFIKLYVKKLSYQAHICIIYIMLKKNALKTCIKTDINYKLSDYFRLLSFTSVFFTSATYNKVKFILIIKVYKNTFLSLHHAYSLILKKSSVKLKTK